MSRFPIDYNDRKPIGKTGETITAIGLGTWAIRDYSRAYKTFVYAIENGIDNIDTAEMYDSGRAEEFVGRVVREVGKDKVFVTTKMLPQHLVSTDEVLKAAKASLKRLGLSEVDLFLIHWPNRNLSIEEQVRNFEIVYEEGLARYIGVSNFNVYELEKAIHATRKAEIVVDQVHYSVLTKDIEKDLLPYAIKNGITIQAYTPLERSRVSHHPTIIEIAKKINKTPVQVALNYLISRPNVVAIPKTENIEHVKEIIGAMGWRLGEKEISMLENI
ncbi:aldo/keto reductase [Staphylothermus hellenicus]|uniref:Aldo/keto reductase n=1 Tax=Staphylothermus hellenicus (strain DSM 12710 / JCM 10830 / BK20S6-10-b1 / P8) TaxID=591019 RepID=D7D9A5_STAHD|nr:aldo/keto reductase [Staphylothermus hellenicus]ADI32351.1 aldo/keto reductase [Staphylothermus hellenicus DSM 12710]